MEKQQTDFEEYLKREEKEREEVFERFEENRADFLSKAREVARWMAKEHGTATSPRVYQHLLATEPECLKGVNPAALGALFKGAEWELVRYVKEGSHRRIVGEWRLKDPR